MNQRRHRLVTHCHLYSMSPFITPLPNISQTRTQRLPSSPSAQGTFDQITVNLQTQSPILTTFPSDSCSYSSSQDHCLPRVTAAPLALCCKSRSIEGVCFRFTSERCAQVGRRGAAGVCVCVHRRVGGEVPPLQRRSPRPLLLIHLSCGHLRPIKSH